MSENPSENPSTVHNQYEGTLSHFFFLFVLATVETFVPIPTHKHKPLQSMSAYQQASLASALSGQWKVSSSFSQLVHTAHHDIQVTTQCSHQPLATTGCIFRLFLSEYCMSMLHLFAFVDIIRFHSSAPTLFCSSGLSFIKQCVGSNCMGTQKP